MGLWNRPFNLIAGDEASLGKAHWQNEIDRLLKLGANI